MDSNQPVVVSEIAETARQIYDASDELKRFYGDDVNKAGRAHKVITLEKLKKDNEELLRIIELQKKEIETLIYERSLSKATKSVVSELIQTAKETTTKLTQAQQQVLD